MSNQPDWYEDGLKHIWLPYTQMKTASPPLAAAATDGTRITLADGRELVDGIASWWTACHGYNHPHIRKVVQQQLETLPHVNATRQRSDEKIVTNVKRVTRPTSPADPWIPCSTSDPLQGIQDIPEDPRMRAG